MAANDGISVERLDWSNYPVWAANMRFFLTTKKCWHTVASADLPATDVDRKADELALSYIGLCVKPQHQPTILRCTTAHQAWTTLKDLFAAKSFARKLQLRRELNTLKMATNETVTAFASRAKALQDQLATAGHPVNDFDVACQVLAGLPSSFDTVVTVIETTMADTGALTVDHILPHLLQAEQRRVKPDHSINANSALMASFHPRRDQRQASNNNHRGFSRSNGPRSSGPPSHGSRHNGPHRQQQPGHSGPPRTFANERSARDARAYADGTCLYCHKPGHYANECHKKRRDTEYRRYSHRPPPPHRDANQQYSAIAFTASSTSNTVSDIWIVDTGASRHITPHQQLLTNLRPAPQSVRVTFGNGSIGEATLIGDAYLQPNPDNLIKLTDVLYMPEAADNLLSVSQASKRGINFTFNDTGCQISMDNQLIAYGHADPACNTYRLASRCLESGSAAHAMTTAYAARAAAEPSLWHRRLGHLGYDNLAKLTTMATGINIAPSVFKTTIPDTCGACILGKQHRLPFNTSTSVTTRPLELLHTDLCGPMPVPSHGGNSYFISLLDDYTGYSIVAPLRHKSGAADFLKTTITMLECQTGHTVKRIRSDNGGEFINNDLATFYQFKGIKSETTVPYTPQQNGKAERLNRTLLDKARPMLAEYGLSKSLWGEAIATANYLRNRSPMSTKDANPYEMLYGTKPDLSHLRTFGARAYVLIPAALRTKLDAVSAPGRFIGYPANTKGYKVLLDIGTIVISRDVTFDETSNPLSKTPKPQSSPSKTLLPKTHQPETIAFHDNDDNETVGAPAPTQPEAPPSPPIALRRPERAAANRPASMWQDNAYRITNRTTVHVATTTTEPTTLEEALQSPHANLWRHAMDEEIASLAANNTWTMQPLPPDVKPIPVKWVFKEKRDANGNIERHKARLVVKGFHQREGIDYDQVFAPVSKYSTLRIMLAIATDQDLDIHHLDVKTAFLNGKLDEDVFIQQPPGYHNGNPALACKLNKALYGLKQASRAWHRTLKTKIESLGFTESTADPGLFVKTSPHPVYLLIYVDDILVITGDATALASTKTQITTAFDTRDLGPATFFLGIDIVRDRATKTIKLTQTRHTTDLLSKFNMDNSKPFDTPSSIALKLTAEGERLDTMEHPYSTLIGSLMYLASCTRPDIAQPVGALARYMSKPTTAHWTAAKHVLRYLAGTTNYGIVFTPSNSTLDAYCDANHAGDIDTRRSTTGYVFTFNNGAITWSSRLQPTVAASTTEAEYMAAAATVKEGLWLRKLFGDLDLHIDCIDIRCDSQSAIHMLKNPVVSLRSKHIDIVHHFARERVARGEVKFSYIPTDAMVADILTKPLPTAKFKFCRAAMGIA
jgi:histone deacetylase 1/2